MAWTSLQNSLSSKPHVLAGPVLRKVTTKSVTVWLALRMAGTVVLTVVDSDNELTGPGLPEHRLRRADANTHSGGLALQNGVDRNTQTAALGSQQPPGDRSRVSAPTLSLPKGGGAIRGMGEKFAANPVTGMGSMTAQNRGTSPHLPRNNPIEGKPNLALRFEPGFLPSFALPLVELTDLRDLCSNPALHCDVDPLNIDFHARPLIGALPDDALRQAKGDIQLGAR